MKKFLYGRLHDASKGYDFYVRPEQSIGPLLKALSTDLIPDAKPLLFLYSHNGQIIFGLRQQLSFKDSFGRLRANFTGYELQQSQSFLPFFDALQEKLPEITAEAHECHRLLDQDSSCGPGLRDTAINFRSGRYSQNNDWDRAVAGIQKNPATSLLLMFDKSGNLIPLPSEMAFLPEPPAAHSRKEPAPNIPASSSDPASYQRPTDSAGIKSDVRLEDHERIKLPPPPDMNEGRKEPGLLGSTWRALGQMRNKLTGSEEKQEPKKNNTSPRPPKRH